MAVTEMLRLLIDADTSGAVRGINQLGATAKRELSKSEQAAQKWGNTLTNIGAGMIALGTVSLIGLGRAAKASEEANLSVVKLENTLQNMPQLAGESSEQFIELADSIQDVTAADADQIVAAEAMLGTFKLTADEIKKITPLVVDYARKFGVDLVDAATQVGKALDGNVGALKRNGVSIDETAFAADRFMAVQQALSEQVGGFAQAEGATFAGSLQRLKNEMGDLAEGVGTGAVDAFSDMFGVVDGVTDRLNELSPATQNTVGKIATFASVGLIAAGGVSVLIGQLVKMQQNFAIAREAVAAFVGSGGLGRLTRMGLIIGGLIILRETLMALQDDMGDIDVSTLENELLDLADTGEMTGEQLKSVFDGLGDLIEGGDPQKLEAFGDKLNEVDKALASLAGRSPEKAAEAFREITDALTEQGVSTEQIKGFFDDYAAAVANADTASRIGAEGMGEFAGSTEEATSALKEYNDTLHAMVDPQFAMIDAMRGSTEAQTELRDATTALAEARAAGDVEAIADAENRYTDAVDGARTSVVDLQTAANDLKDSMQEQGLTAADVTAEFIDLATQQGFTAAEALTMAEAFGIATNEADTLGRTDPNVRVTETGTTNARTRLRQVRDAAHSIPSRRNVHASTSGVFTAIGQLDSLARRVNSMPGNVRVSVGGGGGLILHEGGIVPGPRGQEVAAILQAGEHVTSLHDMDAMRRGGFAGGGAGMFVNVDLRGAIVPNSGDLDRIVSTAVNRGVRQGGIQLSAGGTRVEVRR